MYDVTCPSINHLVSYQQMTFVNKFVAGLDMEEEVGDKATNTLEHRRKCIGEPWVAIHSVGTYCKDTRRPRYGRYLHSHKPRRLVGAAGARDGVPEVVVCRQMAFPGPLNARGVRVRRRVLANGMGSGYARAANGDSAPGAVGVPSGVRGMELAGAPAAAARRGIWPYPAAAPAPGGDSQGLQLAQPVARPWRSWYVR